MTFSKKAKDFLLHWTVEFLGDKMSPTKRDGALMTQKSRLLLALVLVLGMGCASESKQVRKLTKPVDDTAENIVRVREYRNEEGEARAIVSPADERQLKFTF